MVTGQATQETGAGRLPNPVFETEVQEPLRSGMFCRGQEGGGREEDREARCLVFVYCVTTTGHLTFVPQYNQV